MQVTAMLWQNYSPRQPKGRLLSGINTAGTTSKMGTAPARIFFECGNTHWGWDNVRKIHRFNSIPRFIFSSADCMTNIHMRTDYSIVLFSVHFILSPMLLV